MIFDGYKHKSLRSKNNIRSVNNIVMKYKWMNYVIVYFW